MKKPSGALTFLVVFILMTALMSLVACGGNNTQSTQTKETLSVNSEPSASESVEPESEAAVEISDNPFYVLVVGDDTREGTVNKKGVYADGKGRSDTLMVVRIDPKNYQLTLLTIPRDSPAYYDGEKIKINEVYNKGGIEALLDSVKDLTGVRPQYYLITTFVGFEDLVDDLGGLSIRVPLYVEMDDVVSGEIMVNEAGDQNLNGKQALVFARDRHSYDGYGNGEAYRQTNDRRILQRLIEQILGSNDTSSKIAEGLLDHITTNWDKEELLAYVDLFAKNAGKVSFIRCTGPYDGDIDPDNGKWFAFGDDDSWARIMEIVDQGGDPAEVIAEPISYEQDFM